MPQPSVEVRFLFNPHDDVPAGILEALERREPTVAHGAGFRTTIYANGPHVNVGANDLLDLLRVRSFSCAEAWVNEHASGRQTYTQVFLRYEQTGMHNTSHDVVARLLGKTVFGIAYIAHDAADDPLFTSAVTFLGPHHREDLTAARQIHPEVTGVVQVFQITPQHLPM